MPESLECAQAVALTGPTSRYKQQLVDQLSNASMQLVATAALPHKHIKGDLNLFVIAGALSRMLLPFNSETDSGDQAPDGLKGQFRHQCKVDCYAARCTSVTLKSFVVEANSALEAPLGTRGSILCRASRTQRLSVDCKELRAGWFLVDP